MKVTIYGENKFINLIAKYEGIDYDIVTIRDIHRRNGITMTEVRIKRGKRDIVLTDGICPDILTVQDEETGRYLYKHTR